MPATKRKFGLWERFVGLSWIALLLSPFLIVIGLAGVMFASRSTSQNQRWAVGVSVALVTLGWVGFFARGNRIERRIRELEAEGRNRGWSNIEVKRRKTHYRISFTLGSTRQSGKCRIHVRERRIEWMAEPVEVSP